MSKTSILSLPILLAMAAGAGFAQTPEAPKSTPPPVHFYKLDFAVKELEGAKVINARSYSMTVAADAKGTSSIRTGSRTPIPAGQGNTQYIDVGVNIDCRNITELHGDLSLSISADISSVPSEPGTTAGSPTTLPPTVRQNRWSSSVIVPLKKPTLVFSSDDLASKRQMQLEITATPIM